MSELDPRKIRLYEFMLKNDRITLEQIPEPYRSYFVDLQQNL